MNTSRIIHCVTLAALTLVSPAVAQTKKNTPGPRYDGYLFAYFEGQGPNELREQLRFGVSADGVNWSALNKDLFTFTQAPESFTKNFNPRHGTIMSITREEAQRLQAKWGGVPEALLNPGEKTK